MMGVHRELVNEGKTKKIFMVGHGIVYIQNKDDITAGDGEKRDRMSGKAQLTNLTTCNIFEFLNHKVILTHYICPVDSTTFEALMLDMIPLECVARRLATGSILHREPELVEGVRFDSVRVEFFEKDDGNHDPLVEFDFEQGVVRRYNAKKPRAEAFISEQSIVKSCFDFVTPELLCQMEEITARTFELLESEWAIHGGTLFDFKIEFGFDNEGRLLIGDEINNDSWRLRFDGVAKDKQAFRDGSKPMADIKKDYIEVAELSRLFNRRL